MRGLVLIHAALATATLGRRVGAWCGSRNESVCQEENACKWNITSKACENAANGVGMRSGRSYVVWNSSIDNCDYEAAFPCDHPYDPLTDCNETLADRLNDHGPSLQITMAYNFTLHLLFLGYFVRNIWIMHKTQKARDKPLYTQLPVQGFTAMLVAELLNVLRWMPLDPWGYNGTFPLLFMWLGFEATYALILIVATIVVSKWCSIMGGKKGKKSKSAAITGAEGRKRLFNVIVVTCILTNWTACISAAGGVGMPDGFRRNGVFSASVVAIKYTANAVLLASIMTWGAYEVTLLLHSLGGSVRQVPAVLFCSGRKVDPDMNSTTRQAYQIYAKCLFAFTLIGLGMLMNVSLAAAMQTKCYVSYSSYSEKRTTYWFDVFDVMYLVIPVLIGVILKVPKHRMKKYKGKVGSSSSVDASSASGSSGGE